MHKSYEHCATDPSPCCEGAQSSGERGAMIWNLTQNVCFLEFWGEIWRLDVMPNNHRKGRTAFKHFPCIRLLKWHSFAGCWHFSQGILQTHGVACYVHPWFKHSRYSPDQEKTDISGSVQTMWKEWAEEKKGRQCGNQEFVTLDLHPSL